MDIGWRHEELQLQKGKSSIHILVYRWAGHWGPFKVKIPCGECSLTNDVIADTMEHELAGIPVKANVGCAK